jgi:hypothetical protein
MVELVRKIIGTQRAIQGIQTILNMQLFRSVIENSAWLKYRSFTPGGWAMDNAALYTLFRILNDVKPKRILEFGLGQSSKMVHQYAAFSEDVTALTIEHDNNWIRFFCNEIPQNVNVTIKQFDTETVKFNGFETLSYKNINQFIGDEYDLIIVDGPFGSRHYSRSQIIDIVKNGLPEQFCIFMDDTERDGEKETIGILCKILQSMDVKYLIKDYNGEEKHHTIICSNNLKFLISLR